MLKDCPDKPTPEILAALRTGSGKDYPSDELCAVRWAAILAALPASDREAQLLAGIDRIISYCNLWGGEADRAARLLTHLKETTDHD